jgi:ketosteroid isomerase-like protein
MRALRNDPNGRRDLTRAPLEVHIVGAWHEALNSGDTERLVGLSHPDVEVGGPRGSGHGAQLLREWVGRANISLEPRRIFHRADTVVAEQWAEWHSADTGRVTGSQAVSSVFVVRNGRVVRVMRYPDLAGALGAANLDESHETQLN